MAGGVDVTAAMTVSETAVDALPRCNVLGVGISAINLPLAVRTIARWIERGDKEYVCVTGMHGVTECQNDEELKRIHNSAGMVTPDGMPMVWLSRLHGCANVTRVYGPDLMLAVCEDSIARETKHFFFGGGEGVAELLANKLRERFPGLAVAGTFCPPFGAMSADEEQRVIEMLNASGADIIWVGLSTPKQERWMARNRSRLNSAVLIGVGAAFDFHAGLKKQAPKWMQRSGLEWFFRLVNEPTRLWKRYLVGIPVFLCYLMLQHLHLRKFQLDIGDEAEELAGA